MDRGELEDTLAGTIFIAVPLACCWAAWEAGRAGCPALLGLPFRQTEEPLLEYGL